MTSVPPTVFSRLPGTALLRVTGGDRLEFVHGQISSEVKRLDVGEASEGLLLNAKGHALAQLAALRDPDAVLVAVDDGALELVRRRFEEHIIFDDVALDVLPWQTFTVQGEAAAAVLREALDMEDGVLPSAPGRFVEVMLDGARVLVRPARRSAAGGYDLYGPIPDEASLAARLKAAGAQPVGEDELELLRVLAGIPSAAHEAGEGVLPQEAGLDTRVNYRKGCYLGQEIMARIEARGTLRRALRGLKLSGWPDASSRDVRHGDKVVGRLGTLVRHPELGVLALAVLRRDLPPEAALEVGEQRATLEPLPFV